MSECNVPFKDLHIEDLRLIDQENLEKVLELVIPVLFQNGDYGAAMQRLALLQKRTDLEEITIPTNAITALMIRGGLYQYSLEAINSLLPAIVIQEEKGKDYWVEELKKALTKDENLKSIDTWLNNLDELLKIAEIFDQKELIRKILEEAAEKDKALDKIDFWLNNRAEIIDLIKKFDFVQERIKARLESAVEKDKDLNTIKFWLEKYTKMRNLAEAFDFVQEKIKDKAESAIENDESLKLIDFLYEKRGNLSVIIGHLGLSEERIEDAIYRIVQAYFKKLDAIFEHDLLEAIVQEKIYALLKTESSDLFKNCLTVAKEMDITIYPNDYQDLADKMLKRANDFQGETLRENIIAISHYIYKGLEVNYDLFERKKITDKYIEANQKNRDNAVLKVAAKVLHFEYKRQSFWDF